MSEKYIEKGKRIEFIDALRGFVMILVVMCHVSGLCLGIDNGTLSANKVFVLFREPTFFFISGFVFYKIGREWDLRSSFAFLKTKFSLLIIPPLSFMLIHASCFGESFVDSLFHPYKAGYWFTFALFYFFVFYVLIHKLTSVMRLHSIWEDIFLVSCGTVLYVASIPSIMEKLPISSNVLGFLGFVQWFQFLFFSFGIIIKKHFDTYLRFSQSKDFITICIIIFFVLLIFRNNIEESHFQFFRFLTSTTGVFILLEFFRSNVSWSLDNHIHYIGGLCYIGRRTLDIYFLHYFFIPNNMLLATKVFHQYPMPIYELVVSFGISLIIVAVCLLISSILRLSPLVSHLLFGNRYN